MPTFGLIFILAGILLGRQVVTGRVKETPSDVKGIFQSVLTGDFATLQQTLALRGENAPPDVSGTVAAGASGGAALTGLLPNPDSGSGGDLISNMVTLGQVAKGYRLGATGPDFYDCSGLVWAAMKRMGYYTGPRFTTFTFARQLDKQITQVTSPQIGDVVVWNRGAEGHMGVVTGSDQVYAAMSPTNGIGYSTISGTSKSVGNITPIYYRLAVSVPNSPLAPTPVLNVIK